jgi:cephalosporin hydroxylase
LAFRSEFPTAERQDLVSRFHKLYYDSFAQNKTWYNTHFLGARVQKCPFDLWIYQELIYELKPDVIIETGTLLGGSAYYLSTLCDLVGKGRVVTVDIDPVSVTLSRETRPPEKVRPAHPRLTYVTGSSTAPDIFARVKEMTAGASCVLVILDSDHSEKHVWDELNLYAPLVTKGSYVVVEDSNINGHPVYPEFGPGPMEAIDRFMKGNTDFVIDTDREHHMVTFNPKGYLKRVK